MPQEEGGEGITGKLVCLFSQESDFSVEQPHLFAPL